MKQFLIIQFLFLFQDMKGMQHTLIYLLRQLQIKDMSKLLMLSKGSEENPHMKQNLKEGASIHKFGSIRLKISSSSSILLKILQSSSDSRGSRAFLTFGRTDTVCATARSSLAPAEP